MASRAAIGGVQFRSFSLSAEKRRPASTRAPPGQDEQDAGSMGLQY